MKVLRGGTLIDGTGAAATHDSAILIDDGRIHAVLPAGVASWPHDAEVVDVSGMTVLPGLIDAHDHLAMHGYELARRWGLDEPSSTRHLRTAHVLHNTLAAGYTTVRDGGGLDAGFRLAIDEGLVTGPRLVLGLTIVSPVGGIGDRVSPSGHDCLVPPDPALPNGVVDGARSAATIVRKMVRAGADVIKCATTGGASSRPGHGPKDAAFDRDEFRALVDEAHALDRRVMCHALGGRGLRMAIEAGVDSIEHGCYLDEDPELIPMMAERGTYFVPTLAVYVYHRDSRQPHVRERARDLEAHHQESVARAMAAGVKVVAGTDAGGHGHPPNAMELQCMVKAGLTPMQAIRTATSVAAECLGLEREIGTVEKGKRADLVVVDGDPLRDIDVLVDRTRIRLVMRDGRRVV
jgi:imidazolonepropionase-like amidohydrolase